MSFSRHTDNDIDAEVLHQIEDQINPNQKMWTEIHDYIRTNDLQQLKTLLSNHTINLNSFHRSTDGDTILHSVVRSNDVEMSCESSVDACSKEARWNSLLPSNSLLQTTQSCSLPNSTICGNKQSE
jgi:hypothetical protein